MGDFHQNGLITTLHNIARRPVTDIEEELNSYKNSRPMGLVLPSLFSELQSQALATIVDELVKVPYLNEIVIGLDRANLDEYKYAEGDGQGAQCMVLLWLCARLETLGSRGIT